MENKGQLIAMDLYESKLKQLKQSQKRWALNIEYLSNEDYKKSYEKQIVF
jgi:16S rRNA (cytosine967-C5)-methyltransferase